MVALIYLASIPSPPVMILTLGGGPTPTFMPHYLTLEFRLATDMPRLKLGAESCAFHCFHLGMVVGL